MAVTQIVASKNGPYRMEGGKLATVDTAGNETEIERPRVSLCRCGHSSTKPFCDGAHRECGFSADEVTIIWSDEP